MITPDHPGQTLVHVHPDPNELGRVYRADLPICADMGEFAELLDEWDDPDLGTFDGGEDAHREWLDWSEPKPRDGVTLDLGPCVATMRERLGSTRSSATARAISRAGGTAIGITGRSRASLLRPRARWATACPPRSPPRLRFRDRPVVCVAGDGDFLMNGQELATAAQYGADLLVILVDNGSYGTIRMHQERDYPERLSATSLSNPDFTALAEAFGGWAARVDRTEDFAGALDARARAQWHPPDPLRDRGRAHHQCDHAHRATQARQALAVAPPFRADQWHEAHRAKVTAVDRPLPSLVTRISRCTSPGAPIGITNRPPGASWSTRLGGTSLPLAATRIAS